MTIFARIACIALAAAIYAPIALTHLSTAALMTA